MRILAWWRSALVLACIAANGVLPHAAGAPVPFETASAQVEYKAKRDPRGPWVIHVVRVPRNQSEFQLSAVHADGRAVGLEPTSRQTKVLTGLGSPIAAINGDFYRRSGPFAGDPRGLQIVEGELISAPGGSASFWIDANGEPHITNTISLLAVTWPGGGITRVGLNGVRRNNGAELFTPALGATTQTVGGREIILEQLGENPWLPLLCGKAYRARVRAVRDTGNSPIEPETLVVSVGPALARTLPMPASGAELTITTETQPTLRGARTAISGGPILVSKGKRHRIRGTSDDSYESTSMLERHPRSAIGWDAEAYYLVQVDGRHRTSVGMTLNELAALFLELGCQEAVNLDGGGSATLWFDGRVRNRPCDGHERPVANSLVVLRKKAQNNAGASSASRP